mmetsp:Transcript_152359/g.488760  ORF Transcript_152359/g.488760 Transcript_152359/m.488760 type:complete len:234 (-) Transcript_152359:83-784(-)
MFGERQVVLDEDDVREDPFAKERGKLKLAPGEVPMMTYVELGMQVTTIEVPAMADVKVWHNLIYQLQAASGVVVLRGLGHSGWDKDIYMYMSELWAEICEVVEARPSFIINVAKGDVRSMQCTLAALADVSLATPDASFGFPEAKLGGLPGVTAYALRKRVSDDDVSRLITTGDTIDAREAQRIGLVDFVGDVEVEVARLIYRHCQPKVTKVMYKPDCEKAWKQQEEQQQSKG